MQKEEQHLVVELMEDSFIGICSDSVSDWTDRLPIVGNAVKVADGITICDWIGPGAALSAIGVDE